MSDRLRDTLEGIKERADWIRSTPIGHVPPGAMIASQADVPRLLAAVEAVLDTVERHAAGACGDSVRKVITDKLTGEDHE